MLGLIAVGVRAWAKCEVSDACEEEVGSFLGGVGTPGTVVRKSLELQDVDELEVGSGCIVRVWFAPMADA